MPTTISNHTKHNDHSSHNHAERYVDPVCGMSTADEEAFIPYDHEGNVYYFCSDTCLATPSGCEQ